MKQTDLFGIWRTSFSSFFFFLSLQRDIFCRKAHKLFHCVGFVLTNFFFFKTAAGFRSIVFGGAATFLNRTRTRCIRCEGSCATSVCVCVYVWLPLFRLTLTASGGHGIETKPLRMAESRNWRPQLWLCSSVSVCQREWETRKRRPFRWWQTNWKSLWI